MTFETFSLHPQILKALSDAGYKTPTKIQKKAIPLIAKGGDIRASAQTGTGKTAAFLLPALNRLSTPSEIKGKGPRLLILVPTRELAMQISDQTRKYSKYLNQLKAACITGGVPYHKQMKHLSRPYDILIATPGRLIDYINQKKIDFSRLEMLVLDEADRMLDMGFVKPVEQIVASTPSSRQTLMFSATLQKGIIKLSEKLLKDPQDLAVHAERTSNESIEQTLHFVDDMHHKNRLLTHILSKEEVQNTIIFTATKRHADVLVDQLYELGHPSSALHGDMNQRQRTRTIQRLRDGKIKVVVATDVAARGIDVQSITHVINFDLPHNVEDYVHRIGRTGRAGAKGNAISFAAQRDVELVKKIEKFTGQPINRIEIEGFEPRAKKSSAPHPKKAKPFKRGKFRPRHSRPFAKRKKG